MDDEGLIAQNVRQRMEEKGLGPKALSLKAGLNETYVRDILKGRSRNPRQAHLQSLALALGCRVSDLTGEAERNSNRELADLLEAYAAMDDEQRRALLIMVKGMVRRDKPPEATPPGPPPNPKPQRLAACILPVPNVRGRR